MSHTSTERIHARLETIATAMMAIATIATAWCAYQSTVFGGVEEFALHDAEVTNRKVYALQAFAAQLKMVDVSLYTNWANAQGTQEVNLQRFYEQRFPPRLKTAFNAWMATNPLSDSMAPKHPFVMKEYVIPETLQADSLQKVYETQVLKAVETNAHSEHYILLTVVFASVLFFGGITSNISSLSTKKALVVASALILVGSVLWMLTFPIVVR